MMLEGAFKLDKISPRAISIWADVLVELDRRGKVELLSGSYEDVANARIRRHRDLPLWVRHDSA